MMEASLLSHNFRLKCVLECDAIGFQEIIKFEKSSLCCKYELQVQLKKHWQQILQFTPLFATLLLLLFV
jgi:hypothetical protein